MNRINGMKINIERLTDQELENVMGFTWDRIEAGHRDLEVLGIESARRYYAEDLAVEGLAKVIQLRPDVNQLVLFETPDPAA